jgi:hypothetical protein
MIAATYPDAPQTPQLVQTGRTFIEISWTVLYDGGAEIDDYEIDYKQQGSALWTIQGSTAAATQFVVENLLVGEFYEFKVRARNDVGLSSDSPIATFLASEVPARPDAPFMISADQSQITIGWQSPADDGGSPITQFRVLWNLGGEEEVFFETATIPAGTFEFSRTGLNPYAGLPFKFKVIADNDQGSSPESDLVRILAADYPSAPGTPYKFDGTKSQITIRWTSPVNNGGVIIDRYNVYVKPNGESYTIEHTHLDMFNLEFTRQIDPEDIGRTFYFQVTAVNEVGESPRTLAVGIIAGTVPTEALNVRKVTADVSQVTIAWDAPADNGGTLITTYHIYWDNAVSYGFVLLKSNVGAVNTWSTAGTVTASALIDGYLYRFAVVAVNAIGQADMSEMVEIYAAQVPQQPNAPYMISQSATALTLGWTATAVSKNGGSPVTSYKLYWNDPTSLEGYVLLVENNLLQYTVENLEAGYEYRF